MFCKGLLSCNNGFAIAQNLNSMQERNCFITLSATSKSIFRVTKGEVNMQLLIKKIMTIAENHRDMVTTLFADIWEMVMSEDRFDG